MKTRVCELCNADAAFYCPSDSAFLCCSCDAMVHGANFLVARHVRRPLCSECKGFTGKCFSGVGVGVGVGFRSPCTFCPSCYCGDELDDALSTSSSSSSACISSTESCVTPPKKVSFDPSKTCTSEPSSSAINNISGEKLNFPATLTGEVTRKSDRRGNVVVVDAKSESILLNWCRKLGVGSSVVCSVVQRASHALGVCSTHFTVLPFRICLAASLWYSLRICTRGDGSASTYTWQTLKKLELISGSPAKLIVAAETRLARVLNQKRLSHRRRLSPDQLQEGWAECSA